MERHVQTQTRATDASVPSCLLESFVRLVSQAALSGIVILKLCYVIRRQHKSVHNQIESFLNLSDNYLTRFNKI